MPRITRIILYILFALAIVGLIIFSQWFTRQMELQNAANSFSSGVPILFATIVSIIPGILLGLEQLLQEKSQPGSWRLDWPRLILLGIPSLYLAFSSSLFYYFNFWLFSRSMYPYLLRPAFFELGGMILGYIITTSIKKDLLPYSNKSKNDSYFNN